MATADILVPEFDCDRTFGDEKYCFYHPLVFGEFVVTIWSRARSEAGIWSGTSITTNNPFSLASPRNERLYSLSIYHNGNFFRLEKLLNIPGINSFSWAHKLVNESARSSEVGFNKNEVDEVLRLLKSTAC